MSRQSQIQATCIKDQASPPAVQALDPVAVRRWLRVDDPADEADIIDLIYAATEWVENAYSRALITQGFILYMDRFPWARQDEQSWPIQNGYFWQGIQLRRPPVQSITSITYLDLQQVRQTLASSVYALDSSSEPATVRPTFNNVWPSYFPQPQSIQISFVAGYGATPSSVPFRAKLAMRQLIAHWWMNREAIGSLTREVEMSATALLNSIGWGSYS